MNVSAAPTRPKSVVQRMPTDRELGLLQRILMRINDQSVAQDPARFAAVMRHLIQNVGNKQIPLDLVRDVICYQVERGDIKAEAAVCHVDSF